MQARGRRIHHYSLEWHGDVLLSWFNQYNQVRTQWVIVYLITPARALSGLFPSSHISLTSPALFLLLHIHLILLLFHIPFHFTMFSFQFIVCFQALWSLVLIMFSITLFLPRTSIGLSDGYKIREREREWGRVREDEGILNEEHIQLLKLLCSYRTGLTQASPSMLGCNYNSTSYESKPLVTSDRGQQLPRMSHLSSLRVSEAIMSILTPRNAFTCIMHTT